MRTPAVFYKGYFKLLIASLWSMVCLLFRRHLKTALKYQSVKYDIVPLSPLSKYRLCTLRRKVMVLDLDETLIHSVHDGIMRTTVRPGTPPDFVLKVFIDHHPVRFSVHKRPHVDFFLNVISQWYELVIYTASLEIYGAGVTELLDNGRHILQRRFYRQHCTYDNGSYSKNLSLITSDMASVFILDNSPGAYRSYPGNFMQFSTYKNSESSK
ncbi:CTD nuclear envelope phosphatase 1 isoform 1 [Schistosoma japonicum]|uniref:CTD nuclear envelope phosphatase 1 isoform 1 n=1 Tax=Schistosoma japonicum TaxID=6182 RepID=A0A4Z2DAN9_SCHJA|nr:CTD nuclear envelope phosphatase 1 isoform 1 [Schistosoma japonicum]